MRPLSRGRIETFRACQRRFQLRYLEQLPWPSLPPADHLAEAAQLTRPTARIASLSFISRKKGFICC